VVAFPDLEAPESIHHAFLSDERFWPVAPKTIKETGLSGTLVESIICKMLAVAGARCGRAIAEELCLPYRVVEPFLSSLRTRQLIVHTSSAPFNDYYFTLTDSGREHARSYQATSSYVGAAPVTMEEYAISVEAQCVKTEAPTEQDLMDACSDITCDEGLFEKLGPAVNSAAGMFLYGASGNGKSTLAKHVTSCFGEHIWIPRAVIEDDQVIKLFDTACHHEVSSEPDGILQGQDHDLRWVRILRPTVTVGGELTMDNLELRHDASNSVCEAPLQMKSNGGCLLIDDFGRQRIKPSELLNRWVVPLESGYDFLTLPNGKKIQIPFEQLIIFSTNLEPRDLVDEAFLRRIPYKIEIGDPSESEYFELFELYAEKMNCVFDRSAVEYLLENHYRRKGRALRRCHPRDLLKQIESYCRYRRLPFKMLPEHFDRVAGSYFTDLFGIG